MQLMTREYLSNQRGHPLRTCFYSNATNTEGMLHYEHVLYLVDRDLVKYLRIAHNMIRMDFGTCRQFSRISGENFQDVRGTKEESRICERVSRCGRCSRLSQALEPSPDRRSKERLSNSLRAFQQEIGFAEDVLGVGIKATWFSVGSGCQNAVNAMLGRAEKVRTGSDANVKTSETRHFVSCRTILRFTQYIHVDI